MEIKKIFFLLLVFCFFSMKATAQFKDPNFGASLGLGEIKGNSPGQTALSGGVFFGVTPWFSDDMQLRLNFNYARKVEYFLPENRTDKYYSFIKVFSLRAVIDQKLNDFVYSEEGAGLIALNDRTFSDTNTLDYGACFHALFGLDFTDEESKGLKLGGGIDSGITFNQTTASYYIFIIQLQYQP